MRSNKPKRMVQYRGPVSIFSVLAEHDRRFSVRWEEGVIKDYEILGTAHFDLKKLEPKIL